MDIEDIKSSSSQIELFNKDVYSTEFRIPFILNIKGHQGKPYKEACQRCKTSIKYATSHRLHHTIGAHTFK